MPEATKHLCLLYTTFPDRQMAQDIGGILVKERLAGCVNILPGMKSIYEWEGKIETADEVVLLVKTRTEISAAVQTRIKELHPYDIPAILQLPVESGFAPYIEWLTEQTRS